MLWRAGSKKNKKSKNQKLVSKKRKRQIEIGKNTHNLQVVTHTQYYFPLTVRIERVIPDMFSIVVCFQFVQAVSIPSRGGCGLWLWFVAVGN